MSLGPRRIIEDIYWVPELLEVQFKVVNSPNEHINAITTEVDESGVEIRKLEFFYRVKETKERIHWEAPKDVALGGIMKVIEMARTVE